MILARICRLRRSVSRCSAVYAVARWFLDDFRPSALLIPLPAVAPGANRAVVGAVVFRRPPSSVNGDMVVRNLSCGGACMLPAHVCTPLWGLRGSEGCPHCARGAQGLGLSRQGVQIGAFSFETEQEQAPTGCEQEALWGKRSFRRVCTRSLAENRQLCTP